MSRLVQSAGVSTEQQTRPPLARPLPDLDAEREIDFARLARSLAARWWLVAAAVAVGAVIGYMTSLGGGDVYQATTTVYLGQPVSPNGSAQIQSLGTNPATVNEIVRSQEVVADVAEKVGIPPGRLRRGISTKMLAITDPSRRQANNPLVQISVRGPWQRQSAEAANLLAAAVVQEVSGYVDAKLHALKERLGAQNRELAQIDRRIDALQRAATERSLPTVERLNLLTLMGLSEQRRGLLIEDRTDTEQLITLAEEVERSKAINEARAVRVPAQSPGTSIVVGAMIGLLVGIGLALLSEPLLARRRAPAPAP